MSLNLEYKLANERKKAKQASKPKKEDVEVTIFKSPTEEQAWRLQKLMEQPEKEACIPEPKKTGMRQPRAPRDFNPNVMGSTAGAGSGEFHVYRNERKKEYERLRYLDHLAEEDKAKNEFKNRVDKRKAEDEEKTSKKREKRKRLQQRKREIAEGKKVQAEATKIKD
eukprot:m.32973 g.32973  ORF g.32973 m.32973 type:complete len:167 (+) comp14182_c0_seq1:108-608(+)